MSLTSYGARVKKCHIAVESIARGRLQPGKLILWLDDAALLSDLSRGLRRQQSRGLEIRIAANYGPHTKYFPAVLSGIADDGLVTADDDVLYPRNWLRKLMDAQSSNPGCVVAYRARQITLDAHGDIAKYHDWPFSEGRTPRVSNFATGHSGVSYPSSMIDALRSRGAAFESCAPRADDVWLHYVAFESGHMVTLVHSRSVSFDTVSGTQKGALKHSNVGNAANDEQIEATYVPARREALIARIRSEAVDGSRHA
ncbi:hypothetical protein [Microbacterium kunmingense]|uniref:hypothetical protein n=1 Tax=Microbacterium kunmingense TaxID=2915939 RepID=UPI0020044A18|nr:hypothetical protein [Microbacterium kunmingense]